MFKAALFIIDKQAMETTCVQQWMNGEIVCVCVCVMKYYLVIKMRQSFHL